MSTSKPLLICVVGATAIGKTSLAIHIAKAFSTEIISADSRQFFKEMNIGTAVPSLEELTAAPHHFIQHKSIFENYSVGNFESEALETLKQIFKKQPIAIMVGGSGLYINAIVNGLDDFPTIPAEIREALNTELERDGIEELQKELQRVDPVYFKKVDIQNSHRIIRALEVYRSTRKPYSEFLQKKTVNRGFKTMYIGLTAEREIMYDRINKRVDIMMEMGLLNEAKELYPHKGLNALQTVGYKELFQYLKGEITLAEAVEEIKKHTRRFAKRQGTWFRKNEKIHWFDYKTNPSEIIAYIKAKK